MNFELQPRTAEGRCFVELAERHAVQIAERAAGHDREGTFPFENFREMQESRLMAAPVPVEYGGLGLDLVHDTMVGINRLGRADGSTAIAANMHLFIVQALVRNWRTSEPAGSPQAVRFEDIMRGIGRGEEVLCALATEPGTDLLHPRAEATPTEGGWLLNGRKGFATISPIATLSPINLRVHQGNGNVHRAGALISMREPGVTVQGNWDAMGMRASGSHDVIFKDVFIPAEHLQVGGPLGEYNEGYLGSVNLAGNLGLAGAFLGIAEAAVAQAFGMIATRRNAAGRPLAESHAMQHLAAEMEIDLAACRAMLERSALTIDAFYAQYPADSMPMDELHHLMKDLQCTKWFVQQHAIKIVDRALQASGGSGYLSFSSLSRLYRDVRAGPFMQPFSPNEAFQYIGKVTLGVDPRIE